MSHARTLSPSSEHGPVAIYGRVSTGEQKEQGTIEDQRRELTALASAMRIDPEGWYPDDGVSAGAGKMDDRKAFHRMMDGIRAGRIKAVMVRAIDRLTRTDDLRERGEILESLREHGVKLILPTGPIDLNTFAGDMLVGNMAAFAAYERNSILQRTMGGKTRLLANGGKPHAMPPYGLRYDRESKENNGWSIDEAEHAIIREIIELVGQGVSCARIALTLNARKVPPPGRVWQATTPWTIVREARNRYAGRWLANKVKGIWVAVPRLLTDEEIERADAALIRAGSQKRGLKARARYSYMLDQKIAKCARCGGVIGIFGGSRNGDTKVYTCRSYQPGRNGYDRPCGLRRIKVTDVDPAVWDNIAAAVSARTFEAAIARALKARDADGEQEFAHAKLTAARKRITDAERKGKALLAHADAYDPGDLEAALAKLATERKAAIAAVGEAEAAVRAAGSAGEPVDVRALVAEMRSAVAEATPDQRRTLARALLADVTISDEEVRFGIAMPVGGTVVYPAFTSCSTSGYRIHIASVTVPIGRSPRRPPPPSDRGQGGRFTGRAKRAA